MTHTAEPMTLEQVRDRLAKGIENGAICSHGLMQQIIDAIDADLVRQSEAIPAAYCDPSDPINSTAFAWPGTARDVLRHTETLYTHPQQRNAVEVTGGMVHKAIDAWNKYGGHAITHAGSFGRMRAALETTLSAVASRDREDAEHMGAEELAQFVSTVIDFDDCEETSTDYEVLMRWERMGLLECERFLITQQGRKLFDDAARRENKP